MRRTASGCDVCNDVFVHRPSLFDRLFDRLFGRSQFENGIAVLQQRLDHEAVQRAAHSGCLSCRIISEAIQALAAYGAAAGIQSVWTNRIWESSLEVEYHNGRSLEIDLFIAKQQYPSEMGGRLKLARRTLIPGDTGSPSSLSQVVGWLSDCAKQHASCGGLADVKLPLRVLDVSGSAVRLLIAEGQIGRYVCLSHRWTATSTTRLTQSVVSTYTRAIPWEGLSKTFQDAIDFTRRLGLQYIWIDSLCILQDDDVDKATQISLMDTIFQHAYLTIAATSCLTGDEGLYSTLPQVSFTRDNGVSAAHLTHPDPRAQAYARPRIYHFSSVLYSNVSDMFPLLGRGWVLQEWTLSPRVLHFTLHELVWECRESSTCQCSRTIYGQKQGFLYQLKAGQVDMTWQSVVEIYSELKLTYPSDRLRALSGLAKMVQPYKKCTYLAGLWESSLAQDLTWYLHQPTSAQEMYRAPTWSWASTDGQKVLFWTLKHRFRRADVHIKVIDCTAQLACTDPTGDIKYASIVVEGKILSRPLTEICPVNPPNSSSMFYLDHDLAQPPLDGQRDDAGIHLLLVASLLTDTRHRAFLILRQLDASKSLFERIGFFETDVVQPWHSGWDSSTITII